MKAFIVERYGNPTDEIKRSEIPIPVPAGDEVLVEVKATTVNDFDWCLTTGTPFSYRLFFGLFRPRKKLQCPGMEVSGIVVKTGPVSKKFQVGDRVYGDTSDHAFGAYAEYQCVSEKALRKMPDAMDFFSAASLPHASMLAYQGLMDVGKLKSGMDVLINGGGGGVGAVGVQLAKSMGAHVTGVDAEHKREAMSDLGFDEFIDYRKVDFTRTGKSYDLILDARTSRYPWNLMRSLKQDGKYVSIGGSTRHLLALLAMKPLISIFSKKRFHMVALKANKDLDVIEELFLRGELKPWIDGPYPFRNLPEAIALFGKAKHKGKVVIRVGES